MAIFYGKESGIRTQNLYYNSVYKGQDGTLFFGGYSGYYVFYPDKLKISPSVPKMDFTNFWLNGQLIKADKNGPLQGPLFMAKEIYLKYDQNVFRLVLVQQIMATWRISKFFISWKITTRNGASLAQKTGPIILTCPPVNISLK